MNNIFLFMKSGYRRNWSSLFNFILLMISAWIFAFGSAACETKTKEIIGGAQKAGEFTVLNNLHQIAQAQQMYSISAGGQYGTFDELIGGGYLNAGFKGKNPVVTNYIYSMNVKKGADGTSFYTVNADPNSAQAGTKHFYIDASTNLIKSSETGAANASSAAVN